MLPLIQHFFKTLKISILYLHFLYSNFPPMPKAARWLAPRFQAWLWPPMGRLVEYCPPCGLIKNKLG